MRSDIVHTPSGSDTYKYFSLGSRKGILRDISGQK